MTTEEVDAVPNAPIDTLATAPDGSRGVELDSALFCPGDATDTSCMFQANPAGDDAHVQLLVLNRESLAVQSNTSYDPSDLKDLSRAIGDLTVQGTTNPNPKVLVVVTLGSGAVTDVTNLSAAVQQIGYPGFGSASSVSAPFSIIGVPGMESGKAWFNLRRQIDGNASGALVGYLKESAYYTSSGLDANQRVFSFPDVVRFQTRVVATGNVSVQLQRYDPGSRTYTSSALASFDTTGGGLGIATFHPFTLAPAGATTWPAAGQAVDWNGVAQALQSAIAAGDGVVLVSLGQMSGFASEPDANAFQTQVLPAIRKLGGQPDIFARAVNDNDTYSFIGSDGQGTEASSAILSGRPSDFASGAPLPATAGDLSGDLQRSNDGRFVPRQADPSGLYRSQINPVIYQPPTDWPLTPQAGATSATGSETALAWLAQCQVLAGREQVVPGLALWPGQDCSTDGSTRVAGTPSVAAVRQVALSLRTDYYDNVGITLNDVGSLDYGTLFPAGNSIFSASDFQAAQAQLKQESDDLPAVEKFFTNLKSVIVDSQASLTLAMTQVATEIQKTYFSQQNTITVSDYGGWAKGMFDGFTSAAATIAGLADGVSTLSALTQAAGLISDIGGFSQTLVNGPQTSSFTDIDAWLLLDQQLQNVGASVDQAVLNTVALQQQGFDMAQSAVLSDWGRLDTVAANSQGPWSISPDDLTEATNALLISTRQQIWQGYAHQLWTAGYSSGGYSATQFTNHTCTASDGSIYAHPFLEGGTQSGLPTGLGNGIQYWPLQTISTTTSAGARNYPKWRPYIMWERGSAGVLPPVQAVSAIFQDPTSPGASATSAGAYGPWFWPAVFDLTRQLDGCTSGLHPQTTAGNFYGQTG